MPGVTQGWDDFEPKEYQLWCEKWAAAAKRVLKPGGHLLAFSGNRTHHRLFSGVQDSGVEIRDTITWHYSGGFPKSLDVSKSIDKQADVTREVVGSKRANTGITGGDYGQGSEEGRVNITLPSTDAAKKWEGFMTALKPSTEFVVVGRVPFDGTVAENVQTHGTGALNIDASRIEGDNEGNREGEDSSERRYTDDGTTNFAAKPGPRGGSDKGRHPPNTIFGQKVAEQLDREVGELVSASAKYGTKGGEKAYWGNGDDGVYKGKNGYKGGPSRYFYTSKAARSERTHDGKIKNEHPTVKPLDLMEWLVTLSTAEGQIVLDPFAGSGTTLLAAKNKSRKFVGIEQESEYVSLAQARVGMTPDDPSEIREDGIRGLDEFDV